MTKRDKRLQKLHQNPKNVSFEDLESVMLDYGFELLRSSGSHHSFRINIQGKYHLLVVPHSRPVKTVYVREALKLIELFIDAQSQEESEDD